MADFSLSPNMSLPIPTVSEAPGPGWATNIDASLSIIDQHNHSSGQGVQINPAGININSDLPFNNNNATVLRSVNFNVQSSPLALSTDIGCLYVSGVDLYYNDENGNQIRITQSGSVAGSSGTITGLPSGTASASYSAGTFTFQGATNTPASMAVGPIILGNAVANSKTITIAPNAGIAANYNLTLPAALPVALNYVTLDNSGNLSFNNAGLTGSGAVVLATSPTLTTPSFPSGAVFTSGTFLDFAEGTWAPTFTNVSNTSGWVANTARYQRISNSVYGLMAITFNLTNTPSGSFTITTPITPNNNFISGQLIAYAVGLGVPSGSFSQNVSFSTNKILVTQSAGGTGSFTIVFAFSYIINN